MWTIITLFILLVAVSFAHYFLCYRLAIKENPILKNADADKISTEMLNKSKASSTTFHIKDKSFWLFTAYIMFAIPILMNIAEIICNYLGKDWNWAIELISIVLCAWVCFTIASLLGFWLIMLVIKRKHKQAV